MMNCIIKEVCTALLQVLTVEYVREPQTEEEWKVVAYDFSERWNFPHCLGGMDGKHVMIGPPLNSGSLFHNYKGHFSIVLFALVDAFIFADIGTNGRISDSYLKKKLDENTLPPADLIPGIRKDFPYVIVGDEAFPPSMNLLIP